MVAKSAPTPLVPADDAVAPRRDVAKNEETRPAEVVGVYDGIEENNHPLPLWWQWTLYGAVVFAIGYWFYYSALHAPSDAEIFTRQAAAEKAQAATNALAGGGKVTPELLLALSLDTAAVSKGQTVFETTCAPCHRADGGGNIGPNLTDAYWIHGGKPDEIYTDVHDGVPAKGMPTWGPLLGGVKIANVVAYVLTIRGTNVAGGKAPQGDKEEK